MTMIKRPILIVFTVAMLIYFCSSTNSISGESDYSMEYWRVKTNMTITMYDIFAKTASAKVFLDNGDTEKAKVELDRADVLIKRYMKLKEQYHQLTLQEIADAFEIVDTILKSGLKK